jgi:hypothetical protein
VEDDTLSGLQRLEVINRMFRSYGFIRAM